MTRRRAWVLLPALVFGACAGSPEPRRDARSPVDDECSRRAAPAVDAGTSKRLAAATNVIEYQHAWMAAHPGTVLGTVPHAEIQTLVRSKSADVQGCYEAALGRLEDGRGRVVVRFVIDAAGKVPNVDIAANDFDDANVGCCLANRMSAWKFPAPTGGEFVVVEYPFVVRVAGSKPR